MKHRIRYRIGKKIFFREISYIPVRYLFAMALTVLETLLIIGVVGVCCYYIPFFYVLAWITEIGCVIHIASSDENPDYKVPWLLVVMILPIAGFMLYFMFYSRKLKRKYIRRLKALWENRAFEKDDLANAERLEASPDAHSQAMLICRLADSHVYRAEGLRYYRLGEDMVKDLLLDLKNAKHYILMEYFLIEEGELWQAILEILREKVREGVSVFLLYDDIGCMSTLPGNYSKRLKKDGISASPFARLRGNADSEFNNRNHRKITVIDGRIGYTGGVNLADEYINRISRFGHWKDSAVRIEGRAVFELTSLFALDYGITAKGELPPSEILYPILPENSDSDGFIVPFGDGPRPIYPRGVGKAALQSLLTSAKRYVYMTTPYLVLDNELCGMIEHTAQRGVDVRIVVPHVPDKRLVFEITRSYYQRLIASGVRIYEYSPGFIHAKNYVADDKYAVIGTINLDFRSLVHHFENAVWLYDSKIISEIRDDLLSTIDRSQEIGSQDLTISFPRRVLRSVLRIFSPLL